MGGTSGLDHTRMVKLSEIISYFMKRRTGVYSQDGYKPGDVYRVSKQIPAVAIRIFGRSVSIFPGIVIEAEKDPLKDEMSSWSNSDLMRVLPGAACDVKCQHAVELLGERKAAEALDLLVSILERQRGVDTLTHKTIEAVSRIGGPKGVGVLRHLAKGSGFPAYWSRLKLVEEGHESAPEPLLEAIAYFESPWVKAKAISILKNRLDNNDGLRMIAPGLCSSDANSFMTSWNAFRQVESSNRDSVFAGLLLEAMRSQREPGWIISLLPLVADSSGLEHERKAVLLSLLGDRRRGRDILGCTKGRVSEFAEFWLGRMVGIQSDLLSDIETFLRGSRVVRRELHRSIMSQVHSE